MDALKGALAGVGGLFSSHLWEPATRFASRWNTNNNIGSPEERAAAAAAAGEDDAQPSTNSGGSATATPPEPAATPAPTATVGNTYICTMTPRQFREAVALCKARSKVPIEQNVADMALPYSRQVPQWRPGNAGRKTTRRGAASVKPVGGAARAAPQRVAPNELLHPSAAELARDKAASTAPSAPAACEHRPCARQCPEWRPATWFNEKTQPRLPNGQRSALPRSLPAQGVRSTVHGSTAPPAQSTARGGIPSGPDLVAPHESVKPPTSNGRPSAAKPSEVSRAAASPAPTAPAGKSRLPTRGFPGSRQASTPLNTRTQRGVAPALSAARGGVTSGAFRAAPHEATRSTRTALLPSVAARHLPFKQPRTRYWRLNAGPAPPAAAHVRQTSAVSGPRPESVPTSGKDKRAARAAASKGDAALFGKGWEAWQVARSEEAAAMDRAAKAKKEAAAAAAAAREAARAEVAAAREIAETGGSESAGARPAGAGVDEVVVMAPTPPAGSLHGSIGAATPPAAPQRVENGEDAPAPEAEAVPEVQVAAAPAFLDTLPVAPPCTGFVMGALPTQAQRSQRVLNALPANGSWATPFIRLPRQGLQLGGDGMAARPPAVVAAVAEGAAQEVEGAAAGVQVAAAPAFLDTLPVAPPCTGFVMGALPTQAQRAQRVLNALPANGSWATPFIRLSRQGLQLGGGGMAARPPAVVAAVAEGAAQGVEGAAAGIQS